MKHFFFPNSSGHLRSDANHWMQMKTILKLLGGDTVKSLGDISPHPPGFGTPDQNDDVYA